MKTPYHIAQRGLADLKAAIYTILQEESDEGVRNADLGRTLGLNYGHSGRHQNHIPRTMLEIMKSEGVVIQDEESKRWRLNSKS